MNDSDQRPPILRVSAWEKFPQLVHGFCGRRGGVSRGEFAEFNLSHVVGDDPDCVRENWRRLRASLEGRIRFVTMRQQHGAEVVRVEEQPTDAPLADALMSHASGLALGILTADCVPLLLVAPERRVVAAVHAGWRGTVLGIAQRAVQSLEQTFGVAPSTLHAALGPAIGACCYEVERDITDEIERRWGPMPEAIATHDAKRRLDLRRVNRVLLAAVGVPASHISSVGPCTWCGSEEYFSYRAACSRDAADRTGRQLSFVGWYG
ncbi:MAG: peptidoglycan editing factor PgeF [Candidatus Binatia bacterium]